MALKRKRSTATFTSSSAFPSPSTSSDSTTSLPFFYNQSKAIDPPLTHAKPTWSFPTYDSSDGHDSNEPSNLSSHLNSRTRKRHRDDRPSEQSIYGVSRCLSTGFYMTTLADVCCVAASTISRLYEAQRQHPHAEPILSQPISAMPMAGVAASGIIGAKQKSNLHSFWRIRSEPVASSMAMEVDSVTSSTESLMRCEDCDGSIRRDDDTMDLDDGASDQGSACAICRRHVCDRCAVLGNERICLGCTNR